MKKIIVLLSVFIFIISSCSNDDKVVPNQEILSQEGTLIKKIIQSNGLVIDYTYNGNKIIQINYNNGMKLVYQYSGNLISKHFLYFGNVLNEKYDYQYDTDEKLTSKIRYAYSNNSAYKTEYTYDVDGNILLKGYSGNFTSQATLYNDRKIFFHPNGNVDKIETYKEVNGIDHIQTSVFTFDEKNNFEKSILGFNKINDWEFGGVQGAVHNKLSENFSTTENSSTTNTQTTYQYNLAEFPKSLSTNFPTRITAQLYYQ